MQWPPELLQLKNSKDEIQRNKRIVENKHGIQ